MKSHGESVMIMEGRGRDAERETSMMSQRRGGHGGAAGALG
jgi:hypothetical protein